MSDIKSVELKDLVGEHILSGVDFLSELTNKDWRPENEHCQVIRFCLDGKIYTAIEDPDDGYRSCMDDIFIDEDASMKNTFEGVKVRAVWEMGDGRETSNILALIDAETGEAVLEVGTGNTSDYYPYFVASFHPEAMSINKNVEPEPVIKRAKGWGSW